MRWLQEERRLFTRKCNPTQLPAEQPRQSGTLQAEKLASLGQHVLGIIHELSNPLTTIFGNAQRLLVRFEGSGEPPEVRRILEEAERASLILRQLLFLSRDSRAARQRVSLGKLIEHTVDLQRGNFAAGNAGRLELRVESADDLPAVHGDYAQLQQVLLNLLQNARQAIELGGRGGNIGVRTATSSAGQIQLEVWDDGPGIPVEIQPHIFEPFFTTKPPGAGTGLGLSIVDGFVRQHGGTVTYLSRPQGGSRFLVELPVAQDPPSVSRSGEPAVQRAEVALSPTSENAPRVLVVEDEPTVATLIADVLRDEGMRVDVLQAGQVALQQVQRESYDLAICDIKMPGLDGPMFYRSLVQAKHPLRQRVLFVTGDLVAPRTHEFLEKNQLPHLAKPFRVEELSQAVQQALQSKKSAARG